MVALADAVQVLQEVASVAEVLEEASEAEALAEAAQVEAGNSMHKYYFFLKCITIGTPVKS